MPVLAGYLVPHPPLLVPRVGRGQERAVSATADAYRAVAAELHSLAPQTVVLITPHMIMYSDYLHIAPGPSASGSLARFGAQSVTNVQYDEELVAAIARISQRDGFPAGTLGERERALDHGTLVPLHFLLGEGRNYRLVRCAPSGLSRLEHYRFGCTIRRAADELGRRVVVVASGDLSHKLTKDGPYGFAPEGPQLDEAITAVLRSGDFAALFSLNPHLCEKGAECALLPLLVMAGALDALAVAPRLHSYEGPLGVGYAVASFIAGHADERRCFLQQEEARAGAEVLSLRGGEDTFVRLARHTLEAYVCTGHMPPLPNDLPDELRLARAGAFVSIKKDGRLRGCIGTTEPTTPSLAEEIRRNAVSSGTRDPRFARVREEELSRLTYSVDVIAPAEPCTREELDPGRYGVIVSCRGRRGLLLPCLDGVDTAEEQIAIARRKAGIGEREELVLERFQVERHT